MKGKRERERERERGKQVGGPGCVWEDEQRKQAQLEFNQHLKTWMPPPTPTRGQRSLHLTLRKEIVTSCRLEGQSEDSLQVDTGGLCQWERREAACEVGRWSLFCSCSRSPGALVSLHGLFASLCVRMWNKMSKRRRFGLERCKKTCQHSEMMI